MFTQGTVVTSIRSKKYFNCCCYGVVVSARCDIANDKILKIYYIEAIDLESWIFSDVGFSLIVSSIVNTVVDKLQKLCQSSNLDWETMKDFSSEEFNIVVDEEMSKKDLKNAKEYFNKFKKYTNKEIGLSEKKEILKIQKKSVTSYITDIINGKYTHFAFVPSSGVEGQIKNGIIIDLQELDYFDLETVKDLLNCAIDNKNINLECKKKSTYNKKFVLDEDPGYAIELCNISSPWIEYIMQRFANVFTRIGVETPSREDISGMIEEIIN